MDEPGNKYVEAPRREQRQRDFFLSYAHEDKDAIADPLATALIKEGLAVWYDDISLNSGASLRESIDRGLAHARFGIVILSPNFF